MKRDLAYRESPSRRCAISRINVKIASSVNRFVWYANCNSSMTRWVWVVIFGGRALPKPLANIAVTVTGRRSLSTIESGFLWTGTISPIFHRVGITHYSIDIVKMV